MKNSDLDFWDWVADLGEVTSEDISSSATVLGDCPALQLAIDWNVLDATHEYGKQQKIK